MRWKWIIGVITGLLLVLAVTVLAILSSYDFNKFKPMIVQAAKDATGRELKLAGNIELEISLTPSLVVEGVSFQNALWGSRPELVKIRRLEVQVELIPLITGSIEVKRLIVIDPDILIEMNDSGILNLEFKPLIRPGTPKTEEKASGESVKLPAMAFKEVRIENGHLTYKKGKSGKTHEMTLERLTTAAKGFESAMDLELMGKYNGRPFEVAGRLGPVVALTDPGKPWPLNLTISAGKAAVNIKGTMRDVMNASGLDLNIIIKGRSVSDIAGLAGVTGAPDAGPFKVSFKVSDPAAKTYRIQDLSAAIGDSDLSGKAVIKMAGRRPGFTAELFSKKIDLRPFLKKDKGKEKDKARPAGKGPENEKVFSDEPLPLDALNMADADIRFRADRILLPGLAFNKFNAAILLENGELTVKPLKSVIGGGTLQGRVNLFSHDRTAAFETALNINELDMGSMLKDLELKDIIEGRIDADINLHGEGGSVASLMAGLNGRAMLVMGKGRINNKYIDILGSDISSGLFRMLNPFEKKTNYTSINCCVGIFDIKNGLTRITALVLDTSSMSVVGSGKVNLRTEELDLSLKPSPKKGITGFSLSFSELTKPFKLGGTLANPSLGFDPTQAAITLGKAVGGIVLFGPVGVIAALADETLGDENPCLAAIEASKKGIKAPGDKKSKGKKGLIEKTTEGIGGTIKKLFGN